MSEAMQPAQQQIQVDLSQQATVTLPLFQWNAVLGCLRTGHGEQFTWDLINPLVGTIGSQLQQEMQRAYERQRLQSQFQQGLSQGLNPLNAQQAVTAPVRPNGEAQTMADDGQTFSFKRADTTNPVKE